MSGADGAVGRRQRLLQLGSAAAFLAIVAVAVLIVLSESQTSGGDVQLEGVGEVRAELAGIPQNGMSLGQPAAEVTVVEFGDLQCPACKAYAEQVLSDLTVSQVRGGEVRIGFHNNPILGEESERAAMAALAAGMQDRGWSFVTLFYRNQGFEGSGYVTDAFLSAIAQAAGVPDVERWNSDRRSDEVRLELAREKSEAVRLGFSSTPSFAIAGPRTAGLEPLGLPGGLGELEAAIDDVS